MLHPIEQHGSIERCPKIADNIYKIRFCFVVPGTAAIAAYLNNGMQTKAAAGVFDLRESPGAASLNPVVI